MTESAVRRNARGNRIGESHPRARIPDAVVFELRELHDHRQIRYQQLVEMFKEGDCESAPKGIKLTYPVVRDICTYKRRYAY